MALVYRKFGIIQRFNIEDTKEISQIRAMEVKKVIMERHQKGIHILFLESRVQSMSLQICISFFTIYSGSNIWYKILNIYEKGHSRYLNSQLRIQIVQLMCKRFHFCKCPGECPLKNTEQMTSKKHVIALIYKLKLNICKLSNF